MKKTIYTIFKICVLVIILINLFSVFNIPIFGIRLFRVGSGSMEPYLNVRDLIIIKKSDKYEIDDVVTYKKNGEYITHRIISIDDNEVITKGDANNTSDIPISKEMIVGKLIYKFKTLGFISYLFSRKATLILLFIVGLVLTIIIPDKNERKRKKYEEKKKIEKEIRYFSLCLFYYFSLIFYY